MTDERKQDFLLVALVLSFVAHLALMIFIKPQVMTHVVTSSIKPRAREPMKVTKAETPPQTIEMTAVRDIEAVRESPEANDALMPIASALDAPNESEKKEIPVLQPPALNDAPKPEVEIAPYLSEKIYIEKTVSSFATPIVKDSLPSTKPQTSTKVPEAVSENTFAAADVPMFTAPVYIPKASAELVSEVAEASSEKEGDAESAFVPSEEVLSHVDEKVVESEKAAVRELLNVKDAQELEKFVSIVTTSATDGDWTYFRVQINPRSSLPIISKDVVVLLDASGSIGNDRLKSCRKAARQILRSCTNTGDRFNLVAFRDKFSYAFNTWQMCDKSSYERADNWLDTLAAHGRTDVFSVIRSVLTLPRNPSRPLIALVVTDGDANSGVNETAQILSKFTALNDGLISVYMYGVKESANRPLIELLTRGNRGEGYIYTGTRWGAGSYIEGLCEQFRDPVLSDLRIIFSSDSNAEAYPRYLKNLYRGGIVDFVARVPNGQKEVAFSLKGLNSSKSFEGFFKVDLSTTVADKKLPEKWHNESVIDQKIRSDF